MKHIYSCKYLCDNKEMNNPKFEEIFQENVREQKKVNRIFQQNYQKRRNEKMQTNVISLKDPLYYSCSAVME